MSRNTRNNQTVAADTAATVQNGEIVPAAAAPLTPVAQLLAAGFTVETIATMTAETIAALTVTPVAAAAPVAVPVGFDPAAKVSAQTANKATWYAVIIGCGNLSGIIPAADKYSAYKRALSVVDTMRGQNVKFSGGGKTYVWKGLATPEHNGADVANVYYMAAKDLAEFRAKFPELCAALDAAPAAAPDAWDKTFRLSYDEVMGTTAAPDAPAEKIEDGQEVAA